VIFIYDFIQRHPEHVKKIRQFCEEIKSGTDLIDRETALSTFKRKTIQANVSQIASVGATNDEYN